MWPGDEVVIEAEGADRIVVHRAAPDLAGALGVFDGLYELVTSSACAPESVPDRCVLDTDVVIAALDRADAHHVAAAGAFKRWATDEVGLLLCTVNYAEVLVRPAEDERSLRAAVDAPRPPPGRPAPFSSAPLGCRCQSRQQRNVDQLIQHRLWTHLTAPNNL
jgi:hypothetical protein